MSIMKMSNGKFWVVKVGFLSFGVIEAVYLMLGGSKH